jgi:hypothetical protein
MVAAVVQAVLAVTGVGPTVLLYLGAAIPWILVVALGYLADEYATLVHVTGGR